MKLSNACIICAASIAILSGCDGGANAQTDPHFLREKQMWIRELEKSSSCKMVTFQTNGAWLDYSYDFPLPTMKMAGMIAGRTESALYQRYHTGEFPLLITISVNGNVRYQMKYSRDDVVSDEKSF
jgi:hypothetical protein